MQRIPEPDLMENWDQAIAYAKADFEVPHTAFIQRLKQTFPTLPKTGYALDLGCGPGDISIRFGHACPDWKIDGIDGSAPMLKLGQDSIQTQKLESRIFFHQVYLPEEKPPRRSYDLIFSNSLLHHLAEPLDFWRSLLEFSHAQTPVFVMDLMRPENRQIAASMVETYAAGEPSVLREDFFNSLLAAYSLEEIQAQLDQTYLSHLEIEVVSDRHWIAWGYPKALTKPTV